jgi:HNH endonuclease
MNPYESWLLMKRRKPMLFDREATTAAGFADKRSYIKRSRDGGNRTFLFGDDMTQLRRRVFERSRGYCEMPVNGFTSAVRCQRNIDWETMELDHNPSLAQGGDDTEESTRAICRRCHVARHNRTTKWRANEAK